MTGSAFTIGALARSTLLYTTASGTSARVGAAGATTASIAPPMWSGSARSATIALRDYRSEPSPRSCEEDAALRPVLEELLFAINAQIAELYAQQALILRLLQLDSASLRSPVLTKAVWVAMLQAAGLDAAGRHRWHQELERRAAEPACAMRDRLPARAAGPRRGSPSLTEPWRRTASSATPSDLLKSRIIDEPKIWHIVHSGAA
jgi:hypothetical protein